MTKSNDIILKISKLLEAVFTDHRRCTAVTVNAIADHHNIPEMKIKNGEKAPYSGVDVLHHIVKHGLKIKGIGSPFNKPTLSDFKKRHPSGTYYITTHNHAMALIDGKLHDSANGSDRRKLEGTFQVSK